MVGRRPLISRLLNHGGILSGAGAGFVLIIIAVITFTIIGPIFIPKIPPQPYVKDITVVIPNGGVMTAVNAIRTSGFRKVFALSYDENILSHSAFTSYKRLEGNLGDDITDLINTTFVLFGSTETFAVAQAIPMVPDQPSVIGHTFSQCSENGFALLLPVQIELALITKDALSRFQAFSRDVLKGNVPWPQRFRAFCDFHSLHLLLMPCRRRIGVLPKWETLDVIEYENEAPPPPWGTIPKIDEIWAIRHYL
jgi:hypothetical protein